MTSPTRSLASPQSPSMMLSPRLGLSGSPQMETSITICEKQRARTWHSHRFGVRARSPPLPHP